MVLIKPLPQDLTTNRSNDMRWLNRLDPGLCLIFLAYLGVSLPNFNFVPIWDGGQYTNLCVMKAAESLNPLDFNCFNHPSMAFIGLVGWTQIVSYGNMFLLHTAIAILSLFSIYAFYKISLFLYPTAARSLGLYLVTFCYTFMPIILGSAFNLNADQGMMIFLVIYLGALLYDRKVVAVLASTGLLFTKEPAFLIYPLVTAAYFLIFLYQPSKSLRSLYRQINQHIYLLTPIGVFTIYTVIRVGLLHKPVLWVSVAPSADSNFNLLPFSDLFNETFQAQLVVMFIMQFNWIITLVIGVAGLLKIGSGIKRWKSYRDKGRALWRWPFDEPTKRGYWLVVIAFFGVFYVLTRFKTFINPRYFLAIFPLMLLLLLMAYMALPVTKVIKNSGLVILAGLLLWSNFATVDPLSKALFGTFDWGNHQMLNMTSLTGECCGYGQDQLVYNLEYLHLQDLQNALYRELKPSQNTILATNAIIPFFTFTDQLDNQTYERTARKNSTIYPLSHAEDFADWPIKPSDIYFIEFPMYPGHEELDRFLKDYNIADTKTYEQDGYNIKLQHLVRK